MCDYPGCLLPNYENSSFCLLHTNFPEDSDSSEFKSLKELKRDCIRRKYSSGDLDFSGAILDTLDLPAMKVEGNLVLRNAKILGYCDFALHIGGSADISNADVGGSCSFTNLHVSGDLDVTNTTFHKCVNFHGNSFIKGNLSFSGSHFYEDLCFEKVRASNVDLGGVLCEKNCIFQGEMTLNGMDFNSSVIIGTFLLSNVTCLGSINFDNIVVLDSLLFSDSHVTKQLRLSNAYVKNCNFTNLIIDKEIYSINTIFEDSLQFADCSVGRDVSLIRAWIKEDMRIYPFETNLRLVLKKPTFNVPQVQESISRQCKVNFERLGDRIEADKSFFYEMEGKRKQKSIVYRFTEFVFLQGFFRYGVRPLQTFLLWIGFIILFALIYTSLNALQGATGFGDYLYFSITTALTPGFGAFNPKTGLSQFIAGTEAIFGTFIWASFVAIFARKYLR